MFTRGEKTNRNKVVDRVDRCKKSWRARVDAGDKWALITCGAANAKHNNHTTLHFLISLWRTVRWLEPEIGLPLMLPLNRTIRNPIILLRYPYPYPYPTLMTSFRLFQTPKYYSQLLLLTRSNINGILLSFDKQSLA